MPTYTARTGNNADQFPDILNIYIPIEGKVLDMTYGKGVFWKRAGGYNIYANDIDPERGDYSYDFRSFPPSWGLFDAVILDPPYMEGHRTSGRKSEIKQAMDDNYKVFSSDIKSVEDIFNKLYCPGMKEAHRLLDSTGILVVKCQDQVDGGRNKWIHIWIYEEACRLGFLVEDLFVMVRSSLPTMRHTFQLHARKNHSFWWVFRKK